jgi:hypothetical protein
VRLGSPASDLPTGREKRGLGQTLAAATLVLAVTALRDIDFGSTDAESDPRLGEYFVQTEYVRAALDGTSTIFLGRKGSGKTALFQQLPNLYSKAGRDIITIAVTPDEYAWAALREYKEQGITAEAAHTNAWKLTLAIRIASALTTMERAWGVDAQEAIKVLEQFLRENYGSPDIDLKGAATKILTGLKGFNLSAFGFGVGFERDLPNERLLTPTVIEQLVNVIGVCLKEVGVVVLLDRLDDSWDGSEESKTLLIGLLKAGKSFNDQFGLSSTDVGLHIVIFLRSDIYAGLDFDEKDKHRSHEHWIIWTSQELKAMIEARLPKGETMESIVEEGMMRQSTVPFDYIVQRTFLRPREVIQYLTEAKRRGDPDGTFISKDNIKDAEATYSRWKVEDLKQEYRKAIPELPLLLETLRQGVHRYDSLGELEGIIRQKAASVAENRGERWGVDQLFDASAIGLRPNLSGAIRYKSEDSELQLPLDGAVYVHPSLRLGLNIVERRAETRAESATTSP